MPVFSPSSLYFSIILNNDLKIPAPKTQHFMQYLRCFCFLRFFFRPPFEENRTQQILLWKFLVNEFYLHATIFESAWVFSNDFWVQKKNPNFFYIFEWVKRNDVILKINTHLAYKEQHERKKNSFIFSLNYLKTTIKGDKFLESTTFFFLFPPYPNNNTTTTISVFTVLQQSQILAI